MSTPLPALSATQREQIDEAGLSSGTLETFEMVAGQLTRWGFEPPADGQRALAENTLRRIAKEQAPRPTCAAVALVVVQPFHTIMRELAAGQIGNHYQTDVPDLLASPPSDKNLRTLAVGESKFWRSGRGSWFGALVSAESRFNLLREARERDFPDWESKLQPSPQQPASTATTPKATSENEEEAEGGPMTEAIEGLEKLAAAAGAISTIVNVVADLKSKSAGSYTLTGIEIGEDFTTLPDDATLDEAFAARPTKYEFAMNGWYTITGTLQDPKQRRKIALNNNASVLVHLAFEYEWGLRLTSGKFPCLHVRRFRLTQVRTSNPWFTDLNVKLRLKNIDPTPDHPVAGLRLAVDFEVVPASWIVWRYKGTTGGLLEFMGDGQIKAEFDGCQERDPSMKVDFAMTDEEWQKGIAATAERWRQRSEASASRGLASILDPPQDNIVTRHRVD